MKPQRRKRTALFALRMDPIVKEALEAEAIAEDRSLASVINRILEKHVEAKDKRGRQSKE